MADLNASIDDHKTGDYLVTREARGSMVDGHYIRDGAISTFTIAASVQPIGENIQDVPEGRSTDDFRTIFTATALIPESADFEPDHVAIDGRVYRVEKVNKWDHWGETHYVVVAGKVTRP